jgi:hypothetical protein
MTVKEQYEVCCVVIVTDEMTALDHCFSSYIKLSQHASLREESEISMCILMAFAGWRGLRRYAEPLPATIWEEGVLVNQEYCYLDSHYYFARCGEINPKVRNCFTEDSFVSWFSFGQDEVQNVRCGSREEKG